MRFAAADLGDVQSREQRKLGKLFVPRMLARRVTSTSRPDSYTAAHVDRLDVGDALEAAGRSEGVRLLRPTTGVSMRDHVIGHAGRAYLLAKRMLAARKLGVRFGGVSRFSLPRRCRLCGTEVTIDAPEEVALRSDFINVLLDDEYGLDHLSEPPRTICDIGANIGLFSLWARHRFPDATIHSYEPNPRIVSFLEHNLEGRNVEIFPEAVGAEHGTVEMDDRWDSRNAKTKPSQSGNVEMISIASTIQRLGGHIDLLKMDCEGGEWDILQASEALTQVKTIRMEYHLLTRQKTVAAFRALATSAGFECEKIWERRHHGIVWLSSLARGSPQKR